MVISQDNKELTMVSYEGLFILKPDLKEEEVKKVSQGINELVAKHSGTIEKEESWGKRQLSYPVKKFREGYYYKLNFTAEPAAITKLESAYKLNEDIIRALISKR
jgi:small subunit ribosomal protein S6